MATPRPEAGRTLRWTGETWSGSFQAMSCPCEVLVDSGERQDASRLLSIAFSEARRIEARFSRYLPGSIVHQINAGGGRPVAVDEETARLLDFAQTLFDLSQGKFDITSGVLRRAWTFDASDRVPSEEAIRSALRHVGWDRVRWDGRRIRLEPGMEIDLGGICKEYAVDRVAQVAGDAHEGSCLVNFGGDLAVTRPRRDLEPWRVGIDAGAASPPGDARVIRLTAGGLATSGDAHRFLLKDGVRYGHILDPTTGWPVQDAPRSITVAAPTCVEAGMFATLGMLQGSRAEKFLKAEGVRHWVTR